MSLLYEEIAGEEGFQLARDFIEAMEKGRTELPLTFEGLADRGNSMIASFVEGFYQEYMPWMARKLHPKESE